MPVERYGSEDVELLYWRVGLHLGTPVSQNAAGDLLGHVRDTGADPKDPGVRLYRTHEKLTFHSDGADIIVLLCLQTSKSGGESQIVSAPAVYNQILDRRPDLAPLLFELFPFDRNDEQNEGELPYFMFPICHVGADGRVGWFFLDWYIRGSQRHPEAPRLSAEQLELLDLVNQIASDPEMYLAMYLQRGDLQLCKNSVLLHARAEYEDFDEPELKRHLLRLWLAATRGFADGDDMFRIGIAAKEGTTSESLL